MRDMNVDDEREAVAEVVVEGAEGERERERERKKEPFFFSLVSFSSFERFSFLLSFALERAPPRATSRAPKARLLRTVVLLLRQVLLVAMLSKQQRQKQRLRTSTST